MLVKVAVAVSPTLGAKGFTLKVTEDEFTNASVEQPLTTVIVNSIVFVRLWLAEGQVLDAAHAALVLKVYETLSVAV